MSKIVCTGHIASFRKQISAYYDNISLHAGQMGLYRVSFNKIRKRKKGSLDLQYHAGLTGWYNY